MTANRSRNLSASRWRLALLLWGAIAAGSSAAQDRVGDSDVAEPPDPELVRPPRFDAGNAERGPGQARLAPPEPTRTPLLEEVVVVGESEWRLPDLGSRWREAQEEEAPGGRIQVSFFPLYDPENADPNVDLFPRNREMRRVGFIEIFKIRFGRRSSE